MYLLCSHGQVGLIDSCNLFCVTASSMHRLWKFKLQHAHLYWVESGIRPDPTQPGGESWKQLMSTASDSVRHEDEQASHILSSWEPLLGKMRTSSSWSSADSVIPDTRFCRSA